MLRMPCLCPSGSLKLQVQNGLFNLGSGEARTWLDLGKSIFAARILDDHIRFVEMPEILRDKYQYFTEAKIGKLKSAGYPNSLFSLEDAVKDYVTQYLVPDLRLGLKRSSRTMKCWTYCLPK